MIWPGQNRAQRVRRSAGGPLNLSLFSAVFFGEPGLIWLTLLIDTFRILTVLIFLWSCFTFHLRAPIPLRAEGTVFGAFGAPKQSASSRGPLVNRWCIRWPSSVKIIFFKPKFSPNSGAFSRMSSEGSRFTFEAVFAVAFVSAAVRNHPWWRPKVSQVDSWRRSNAGVCRRGVCVSDLWRRSYIGVCRGVVCESELALAEEVSLWVNCGIPQQCQVRMSYKNEENVSSKSVLRECRVGVSSQIVLQKCQERVSSKSVLQECQVRVYSRAKSCVK